VVRSGPAAATLVLVPIAAAAEPGLVGAIELRLAEVRQRNSADLELLCAAGRVLGQGLVNLGLRAIARAATAQAAAAVERADQLAELAAALAGTVTVVDVAAALADHLQQALSCQTFSLR
jgi:hypothetical protein